MKPILIGISGKKQSGKDTVAKYLLSYIIQNSNRDDKDFIVNNKFAVNQYFDKAFSKVYCKLNDNFCKNHIYKFATPLKEIVGILLGIDPSELEKEEVKNTVINDFRTYKISFYKRFESPEYYHDVKSLSERMKYLQSYNIPHSLNRIDVTPRELMQYLGTDIIRNIYPDIWINLLHKRLMNRGEYCGLNIAIVTDVRFKNEFDYIKNNNGLMVRVIDVKNQSGSLHISENDLDDNCHFDFTIYNDKEKLNQFGYSDRLFSEVQDLYDYRIRNLYGKKEE